jgi:hypothetical protein
MKLICAYKLAMYEIMIMLAVGGLMFACHKVANLHSPTNS